MLPCGAASALGFAPLGWWPVWLGAVAVLLHALAHAPWQRQLWMGWAFGLGAAVATTHWIGIALWHQPGMPWGVGVGASAIAWLYSAWPWGLLGMLTGLLDRFAAPRMARWHGGLPLRGWRKLALPLAAVVPGWWSQAWWLSGFPWLVPGTVWLDTPLQGWGPVGGGLLMATLGLGLAASAALGWQAWLARNTSDPADGSLRRVATGIGLLWLLAWGGGAVLQTVEWTQNTGAPVRVGVVQVDMPILTRPDRPQEHAYQSMAWRITDALIRRHQVEVIVWPEALVTSPQPLLQDWLASHDSLLQARALVIGAGIETAPTSGDQPSRTVTNSLLAHGASASGRYDKRELVPMTERWPDSGPWPWLAAWANARPWIRPGADSQPPLVLAGQQVGASICYEDAFPHIYQGLPASVGWLINSSNDGWFARTPVMPVQHLALSRLRALEQQKPLVRAANIGPSAVVDAWGRPVAQTETGRPRMLHADVQPRHGHTPYARWGHAWLWALALPGLLLPVLAGRAASSAPHSPYSRTSMPPA